MPINLEIESGLNYIASQNRYECYFDTIQNILMNADGFREIFAYGAQRFINDDRTKNLFMSGALNYDDCLKIPAHTSICHEILDMMGLHAMDTSHFFASLFNIIVGGMRRYVIIKLQEQGRSAADIQALFGLGGLQSYCESHVPKLRTRYITGRRPSLNAHAGSAIAIATERPGVATSVQHGSIGLYEGALDRLLYILTRLPVFNNQLEIKSFDFTRLSTGLGYFRLLGYNTISNNFDKLVAVYYHLTKKTGKAVHKVAIIRYQGEYYYCDNELGIAIHIRMETFRSNADSLLQILEKRIIASNTLDDIVYYKVVLGTAVIYENGGDTPESITTEFETKHASYYIYTPGSVLANGPAGGGGGGPRRRSSTAGLRGGRRRRRTRR